MTVIGIIGARLRMRIVTRVEDVTVLTDDSDSFDSDPGELLRFFRTFLGRPFHFGAVATISKSTFNQNFHIQLLKLEHLG